MNDITITWLIPLFCVLGSGLSTLLFVAAVVNTARLERRCQKPAPAHRPYEPEAAPHAAGASPFSTFSRP